MKIALVHYAVPPVVGGVEQIIGAHARLFRQHGHEVLVCSQSGNAEVKLQKEVSAEDHLHVLGSHFVRCQAVIVHNVMTMPFDLRLTRALSSLATELQQVRFLAWVHDLAACNPDLAPVPNDLREAHPRFEYVAVSNLRARQFEELTGKTCRIVPNGIDPAYSLALPGSVRRFADKHRLLDGRIVLLHPTRLLRRKNVELGLRIARACKDGGIPAILLITGAEDPHNPASSDYTSSLREECRSLGLEEEVLFVREHFHVGTEELAALYRLADALFLPSRQEGFGLPVLEAALHRIPAFVSDIDPLRELSECGPRFFSIESPAAEVAQQIADEILNNSTCKARRCAIAEYGWEAVFEKHLNPLLRENSGNPPHKEDR